jgi:UDP-N-acetylmuramoyl-tripeptide--D-alanyl-D-alanine ligase
MRELGDLHEVAHREVGAAAAGVIAELVVVGPAAEGIAAGAAAAGLAPGRIHRVPDRAAAVDRLRQILRPGDVVLVKASRGAALETIVEALLAGVAGAEPRP